MSETVFDKILAGELPSHKVYENESVYAFLDINPATQGHTLVIPKQKAVTLQDISDDALQEVHLATKEITAFLREKLGATGFNIIQSNGAVAEQEVPYFHVHIVPRYQGDQVRFWAGNKHGQGNLENVAQKLS